jgi:hypothetical protein
MEKMWKERKEGRRGNANLCDCAGAAARQAHETDVLRHRAAAVRRATSIARRGNVELAAGALAEDDAKAACGGDGQTTYPLEEGRRCLHLSHIICRSSNESPRNIFQNY